MSEKEKNDNVERWLSEAFHTNKKLSVLVEGLGDQSFWTDILSNSVDNLKFSDLDFPFYSSKGTMGKDQIMLYKDLLNKQLIICRDSDNEYLYQPEVAWLQSSFIYQTYTYTKENHLCYARNLSKICKDITLQHFDFEPFIQKYSQITFPVLLNWLHYYPIQGQDNSLLISSQNLEEILNIENDLKQISSLQDLDLVFHKIQDRVKNWISDLDNDANVFEKQESIASLNSNDTIFYLSGHIVFPKVIKPLFEKVVGFLKNDYVQITQKELITAKDDTIKNRLAEYNNRIDRTDISTILKQSYKECLMKMTSCDYISKIQNDISRDFK